MESLTYLLIGLFAGFGVGFWLRHQFDFIKVRENSVFNRKAKKPSEPDEPKQDKSANIPVPKNRYSDIFNKH